MPVMKVASGESGFSLLGRSWETFFLGLAQPWALQTSPASPAFLSPSGNDHLVMLTADGDLYTLGSVSRANWAAYLNYLPIVVAVRALVGVCLFRAF